MADHPDAILIIEHGIEELGVFPLGTVQLHPRQIHLRPFRSDNPTSPGDTHPFPSGMAALKLKTWEARMAP